MWWCLLCWPRYGVQDWRLPHLQAQRDTRFNSRLFARGLSRRGGGAQLQPLTTKSLALRSTRIADGDRPDIRAKGLWTNAWHDTFVDVRVFHPDCPSYLSTAVPALYKRFEREKKRQYGQRVREVELGSFYCPLSRLLPLSNTGSFHCFPLFSLPRMGWGLKLRLSTDAWPDSCPSGRTQWPIGYGVGLRIKRSSVRIRPWPLRWVLGQGSLLPLSQGEAFTLASISYLAILVKYILAKKKKKEKEKKHAYDFSSHSEMVEDSTVDDPAALIDIPAVLARVEEPSSAKTELDTYASRSCIYRSSPVSIYMY